MIPAVESLQLAAPKVHVHRTFTTSVPGIVEEGLVEGHFIIMDYIGGQQLKNAGIL
jgi:hypothetical protein